MNEAQQIGAKFNPFGPTLGRAGAEMEIAGRNPTDATLRDKAFSSRLLTRRIRAGGAVCYEIARTAERHTSMTSIANADIGRADGVSMATSNTTSGLNGRNTTPRPANSLADKGSTSDTPARSATRMQAISVSWVSMSWRRRTPAQLGPELINPWALANVRFATDSNRKSLQVRKVRQDQTS